VDVLSPASSPHSLTGIPALFGGKRLHAPSQLHHGRRQRDRRWAPLVSSSVDGDRVSDQVVGADREESSGRVKVLSDSGRPPGSRSCRRTWTSRVGNSVRVHAVSWPPPASAWSASARGRGQQRMRIRTSRSENLRIMARSCCRKSSGSAMASLLARSPSPVFGATRPALFQFLSRPMSRVRMVTGSPFSPSSRPVHPGFYSSNSPSSTAAHRG